MRGAAARSYESPLQRAVFIPLKYSGSCEQKPQKIVISKCSHHFRIVWVLIFKSKAMTIGRICIIENEKDLSGLLRTLFVSEGFEVETFPNGYPLFEKDNWPDIFIIDTELPRINGLELCRWLKAGAQTSSIPVIFISGSPEFLVLARNSGADALLSKPLNLNLLMKTVKDTLSLTIH
jgi:CheY-like chemotaxis protein